MNIRTQLRRTALLALTLLLVAGSVAPVAAADPVLTVAAPELRATIVGSEVTVVFETEGVRVVPSQVPLSQYGARPDANRPDEGHMHLLLDLQPLVVWEGSEPYTFMNVPPGDHQLVVELVNNDHSARVPPAIEVIQFRTVSAAMLPDTGGPGALVALLATAALILLTSGFALRRTAHNRQPTTGG